VLGKMPDRGGGAARACRRRDLAVVAARAPAGREHHSEKAEPQIDGTCELNVDSPVTVPA
jgi:hypothetical protein